MHYTLSHFWLPSHKCLPRTSPDTESPIFKIFNDALVLLDRAAAFDTMDHQNLSSHLGNWVGIQGSALHWFKLSMLEPLCLLLLCTHVEYRRVPSSARFFFLLVCPFCMNFRTKRYTMRKRESPLLQEPPQGQLDTHTQLLVKDKQL